MDPPLHPRQRLLLLLEEIANSNVQRAEIRYQGLHDDQARELAGALMKTESLTQLDLTSSSISTTGITQVCQSLPSCLMNLTLSSIPLSSSAASALATLVLMSSSLIELHLDDCQLKGEGLAAMASTFRSSTSSTISTTTEASSLKILTLAKNQICSSQDTCRSFGEVLKQLSHLESLDMSRNRLESRGLQALQLHKIPSLRILALWENRLGPSCGSALRDILVHCLSLQELNLRNNCLEDRGILDAFASDREQNYRLQRLYLTSNLLSDVSAECLAQVLGNSFPSLSALYLSCNDIANVGATSFAQVISGSSLALKTLDLYRNKIGNRGGQALADAICRNIHLVDLIITYNRITDVSILRAVRFTGKLNRSGRYLLQQQDKIPSALWTLVLEKMNIELDVRFYFVRRLPELFNPIIA